MHSKISNFFSRKNKHKTDFSLDINEEQLTDLELIIPEDIYQLIKNESLEMQVSYEEVLSLILKKIVYSYDSNNYYTNSLMISINSIYNRFCFILESYQFSDEEKLKILAPYGFEEASLRSVEKTVDLLTLDTVNSFCEQLKIDPCWLLNGGDKPINIKRIENRYQGHDSTCKSLYALQIFFDYYLKGKNPEFYIIANGAPINLLRGGDSSKRASIGIFIRVTEAINGASYHFYEKVTVLIPKVFDTDIDHFLFLAKALEEMKRHLELKLHYFSADDDFPIQPNKVTIFNSYINALRKQSWSPNPEIPEFINPNNPYTSPGDLEFVTNVFQQYDVASLIKGISNINNENLSYQDIQNHFTNVVIERNPWK